MKKSVENYVVNRRTVCIAPYYHPVYESVIHESNQTLYSTQTPQEIIISSCIRIARTSYSGQVKAIKVLFDYHNKIPAIFSYINECYAFPTKSAYSYDCQWFFPKHLKGVEVEDDQVYLLLKNGKRIKSNTTKYVINKQIERSAHIYIKFKDEEFDSDDRNNDD